MYKIEKLSGHKSPQNGQLINNYRKSYFNGKKILTHTQKTDKIYAWKQVLWKDSGK